MQVSTDFHKAYCDEAYGIILPEVAENKPLNVPGLDAERLKATLAIAQADDPALAVAY